MFQSFNSKNLADFRSNSNVRAENAFRELVRDVAPGLRATLTDTFRSEFNANPRKAISDLEREIWNEVWDRRIDFPGTLREAESFLCKLICTVIDRSLHATPIDLLSKLPRRVRISMVRKALDMLTPKQRIVLELKAQSNAGDAWATVAARDPNCPYFDDDPSSLTNEEIPNRANSLRVAGSRAITIVRETIIGLFFELLSGQLDDNKEDDTDDLDEGEYHGNDDSGHGDDDGNDDSDDEGTNSVN